MSKVGWKNKVRFVQNVLQLKKLQMLDTFTYLSWVLTTYVKWFEETACVTNMPSIVPEDFTHELVKQLRS